VLHCLEEIVYFCTISCASYNWFLYAETELGLEASLNYLWTNASFSECLLFRIPNTINNELATLTGKEILKWLVQKGAKIKFFHCDIVLELLFTAFFFCYITATVVLRRENINVANVSQREKDAIIVCYDSKFKNV